MTFSARLLLAWQALARAVAGAMPKGLYARSLLIVIVPMVILQSAIAVVFMERHWNLVTFRLSNAVSQDIAALIDIHREFGAYDNGDDKLEAIARKRFGFEADILPPGPLPPALPRPFFSLLDRALSQEIGRLITLPFWIDTVGQSDFLEVRVDLGDGILRVVTRRSQAYASNTHIFIVWMVSTAAVLIVVANLFMRNQIRPIMALADAAEEFGKGREVEFRPRGAREVRRAAYAFLEMKRRIERAIEQRTTMLNGVSHDLRTILTRFKLSLALLPDEPEVQDMAGDVDEMQRMLEAYLAFARGEEAEPAVPVDIGALLGEVVQAARRQNPDIEIFVPDDTTVTLRRVAMKRCFSNLIGNAVRYGKRAEVRVTPRDHAIDITIDDDGPGVSAEKREHMFRPFTRMEESRNPATGGVGLGLTIARDIARFHGGDVTLEESPLGGLRARVWLPV